MSAKVNALAVTLTFTAVVGGLLVADITQQRQQTPRCGDYTAAFQTLKTCAVASQYTPQAFTDAKNVSPATIVELCTVEAVELALSTMGVRYPI